MKTHVFTLLFCVVFAVVSSSPAAKRSGIRNELRTKRQDVLPSPGQQMSNNEEALPVEGQYSQPPPEQLSPHLGGLPLESAAVERQQNDAEEDEEDDESPTDNGWLWFAGRGRGGRQPAVNLFPIVFGGAGGSRSGGAGAPPANVAIANSWSSGRKGTAASQAFANARPQSTPDADRYRDQ